MQPINSIETYKDGTNKDLACKYNSLTNNTKIINYIYITKENMEERYLNWPGIPDYP